MCELVARARDCITAKKCAYESKEGQEPNERESLRNCQSECPKAREENSSFRYLEVNEAMSFFSVSNIILSKHILEQIAYIYQLDNEACTSNANYWKVIRHGG